MLLIKYSDEDFVMRPLIVEQLRHVANEFLRHQDASRAVENGSTQARPNNDFKNSTQTKPVQQHKATTAIGDVQLRWETQSVDPNPTGEQGPKCPRFPKLWVPLKELVSYFC